MNENVLKPLAIICQSDPALFLLNHALVVSVVAGYRCHHSPSPVTADWSRLALCPQLEHSSQCSTRWRGHFLLLPFPHSEASVEPPPPLTVPCHNWRWQHNPRFPPCPSPQLHPSHLSPDLHHHGQLLGWAGLGRVQATSAHQHVDRGLVSPVLYATDLCTSHPLTVTQERLSMLTLLHCLTRRIMARTSSAAEW